MELPVITRPIKWFLVVCQVVAVFMFSAGYFQVRSDPPKTEHNPRYHQHRTRLSTLPTPVKPIYDGVIFAVIDAFRYDFVYDEVRFPEGFSWLRKSVTPGHSNCRGSRFIGLARTPTVTLSRLKALTAGVSPVFFDFFRNLQEGGGTGQVDHITMDTWVDQVRQGKRHNVLLLGDDTWQRVFTQPNYFHPASVPVESMFVTDTVFVDTKVTDALDASFALDDWRALIVHYLGVDHVGHCGGVASPLLIPKFCETDANLQRIYELMLERDRRRGSHTLLIVLGDHGMTDQGNHGGSTVPETHAACMFLSTLHRRYYHDHYDRNTNPEGDPRPIRHLNQVDLASTLTLLLGDEVPATGTGRFVKETIPHSLIDPLQILHMQAKSTLQLFGILDEPNRNRLDLLLTQAIDCHVQIANAREDEQQKTKFEQCIALYDEFSKEASKVMVESTGEYEIPKLLLAIILCATSVLSVFVNYWIIDVIILALCLISLLGYLEWSIVGVCAGLLIWKSVLLSKTIRKVNFDIEAVIVFIQNTISLDMMVFWCMITIYITITLIATSYMQEEQDLWNFAYSCLLFTDLTLSFLSDGPSSSSVTDSNSKVKSLPKMRTFVALLLVRAIRYWNVTGMEHENYPDMRNFLFGKPLLTLTLLPLSLGIIMFGQKGKRKLIGSLFFSVLLVYYKAYGLFPSLLDRLPSLIDKILFERILLGVGVSLLLGSRFDRSVFALFLIMILKVHNAFPLAVLYLLAGGDHTVRFPISARLSLLHASFFLLGPCHLVASIDFSPAYIGQKDFIAWIVAPLGMMSIWAGPLLVSSHFTHRTITSGPASTFTTIYLWRGISLLGLMICLLTSIHHLFAWIVFAPRLLFELGWTLFYLLPYFQLLSSS